MPAKTPGTAATAGLPEHAVHASETAVRGSARLKPGHVRLDRDGDG